MIKSVTRQECPQSCRSTNPLHGKVKNRHQDEYRVNPVKVSLGIKYKIDNTEEPNIKKIADEYIQGQTCCYQTHIYTDASVKKEEGVTRSGFGIYCKELNLEYKKRLINCESSDDAELIAIKYALNLAKEKNIQALILTDSWKSCDELKEQSTKPTVDKIIGEILGLMLETNSMIAWVKAHKDIEGNERADALAKKACDEEIEG